MRKTAILMSIFPFFPEYPIPEEVELRVYCEQQPFASTMFTYYYQQLPPSDMLLQILNSQLQSHFPLGSAGMSSSTTSSGQVCSPLLTAPPLSLQIIYFETGVANFNDLFLPGNGRGRLHRLHSLVYVPIVAGGVSHGVRTSCLLPSLLSGNGGHSHRDPKRS